jgi:hypothetical protein
MPNLKFYYSNVNNNQVLLFPHMIITIIVVHYYFCMNFFLQQLNVNLWSHDGKHVNL